MVLCSYSAMHGHVNVQYARAPWLNLPRPVRDTHTYNNLTPELLYVTHTYTYTIWTAYTDPARMTSSNSVRQTHRSTTQTNARATQHTRDDAFIPNNIHLVI